MSKTSPPPHWPSPAYGPLTGPWEAGFYFTHLGPLRSKSNYRHSRSGRSMWALQQKFAQTVQLLARQARPPAWQTGTPTQPVADRPVIVASFFARTNIDSGNVDKTILDAVAGTPGKGKLPATPGIVMASDAQVAATSAQTVRTAKHPGVVLAFAQLSPGSCPYLAAKALTALHLQLANLVQRAAEQPTVVSTPQPAQ